MDNPPLDSAALEHPDGGMPLGRSRPGASSASRGGRGWASYVRAAILLVLGALLVWLVLTRGLAAYFADTDPEKALRIFPRQSTAMLNLADRTLQALADDEKAARDAATEDRAGRASAFAGIAKDAAHGPNEAATPQGGAQSIANAQSPMAESGNPVQSRIERVRNWAAQALAIDPLNARAMRILGQADERENDQANVEKLMRTAVGWSRRETYAAYWLLGRSAERRDYAGTAAMADMILRTRSKMAPYVMPLMSRLAETKEGTGEIKRLLALNPPWRGPFVLALPSITADSRMPLDVLLSLKDSANPPTRAELKGFMDTVLARKQFELAYYTWLQFLPPEQLDKLGLLFNGSFELDSTDLPFDWQMPQGTGVTVQIADRTERPGTRALRIDFGPGRPEFQGVSQLVMLAPGTYRVSGNYMGDLKSRRGLTWRVVCASGEAPQLGISSPFNGATPAWASFQFQISVPSADCRAQRLQLVLDAHSESEKLVSGTVWYDELRISRVNSNSLLP